MFISYVLSITVIDDFMITLLIVSFYKIRDYYDKAKKAAKEKLYDSANPLDAPVVLLTHLERFKQSLQSFLANLMYTTR